MRSGFSLLVVLSFLVAGCGGGAGSSEDTSAASISSNPPSTAFARAAAENTITSMLAIFENGSITTLDDPAISRRTRTQLGNEDNDEIGAQPSPQQITDTPMPVVVACSQSGSVSLLSKGAQFIPPSGVTLQGELEFDVCNGFSGLLDTAFSAALAPGSVDVSIETAGSIESAEGMTIEANLQEDFHYVRNPVSLSGVLNGSLIVRRAGVDPLYRCSWTDFDLSRGLQAVFQQCTVAQS